MTTLAGSKRRVLAARNIAIIQRVVPHYRVAFYNQLRNELNNNNIRLALYAGQPRPEEAFDDCRASLPWLISGENYYLPGGLYYQPFWSRLLKYDIVILEHANAPLANHLLLASRLIARRPTKLIFWGHGDDFQNQGRAYLRRNVKSCYAHLADHWLAYTEASRERLLSLGLPPERITVINNSVDTSGAIRCSDLGDYERRAIRANVGLNNGPLAVFCSRLHEGKQLPFLIEACRLVHARRPDFQLLVIGDGAMTPWLRQQTAIDRWIVAPGARYGVEKSRLLAASDLMLMPAHIGLSILDGFAAGLPIESARFNNHSPELAYLQHGKNGFLSDATTNAYAQAILQTISDYSTLSFLQLGAITTAAAYSMSAMVRQFCNACVMIDTSPIHQTSIQ